MARRRSNKRDRRIRSKTSIRKTKKTRKTKRVKSKKRSKKIHGGANAGNLNQGEAKEYIKLLLTTKSSSLDIPMHIVSKVYNEKSNVIVEEILRNLNKNNDEKVYSVEDLYDATIAYVESNK